MLASGHGAAASPGSGITDCHPDAAVFHVDFSKDLSESLGALTTALDDRSDLQTILDILSGDLAAAIGSFAGSSISVYVENESFTCQH